MTIPHYKVFALNTRSDGILGVRGPNISKIDGALQKWWERSPSIRANEQAELLANIISACSQWMKLKRGTQDGPTKLRRPHIVDLANAVLDELQTLSINTADEMHIAFNRKKIRALNATSDARPDAVKMFGAFGHERSMYLANKKSVAPSGTLLRKYVEQSPDLEEQKEFRRFHSGTSKKKFEELSESDFHKLYKLANQKQLPSTVEYMKKVDRFGYWVEADAKGRLLYKKTGQAVTTTRSFIWAMDEYGNLFCAEAQVDVQRNHSSFNAGKDVICAGGIEIMDGLLKRIDNESGHYRPDRSALHKAVMLLHDEGVCLDDAVVGVAEVTGMGRKTFKYKAQDFLRDPNTPEILEILS